MQKISEILLTAMIRNAFVEHMRWRSAWERGWWESRSICGSGNRYNKNTVAMELEAVEILQG